MQLGEPKIRQWGASFAVNVGAEFQLAASSAGNNQRQVVILMGGAIAHAGSEGENGIIEQRGAVGFLDVLHSFKQSREGKDVEAVYPT